MLKQTLPKTQNLKFTIKTTKLFNTCSTATFKNPTQITGS